MTVRTAPRALLVLGVMLSVLLSACGTRVDRAEVEAGVRNEPVTLTPESVQALTQPGGAGPATPTAGPSVPTVAEPGASARSAEPSRSDDTVPAKAISDATSVNPKPAAKAGAVAAAGCPASLAPVAVGQVGLFSGVLGPITASMRAVALAWAADLNARGGLRCHPVTVFSRDDGGDPSRSAYLAQDLIDREHVVAFIASAIVVPAGFQQVLARAKVPAVGGPGGTSWRNSPWVFPESASNEDIVHGLIRNGVDQGKSKLGLVYCVEASVCTEAAQMVKDEAGSAGAQLLYSSPASITQTDYTAECLNARKAGVDQFVMGLDGASIARLARSCQAIGYQPLFSTSAALFSPKQAEDPLVRQFGVATVTGGAPWMLDDTPGLREYHRVMSRWIPQTPPDGASVIGFTAGRLLEAALANVAADVARGPITPALVLRGLGAIKNESLGGLTVGLTFSPGQKAAPSSRCVFYLLLGTNGWTTPKGSKPVCRT